MFYSFGEWKGPFAEDRLKHCLKYESIFMRKTRGQFFFFFRGQILN